MYMKYSEAILGMDPGRGEEFDALYAQEGKERSEREQLRQKRKIKKEESKTKSFRAKLRELSMSPRTRIKEELENLSAESTQELSIEDKRNLKDFNKALIHRNKPSSSEKSKTGTESIKESPGSWLFKSAKRRKKEWLQQQLDLRRKVREQAVSPKKKKLIRHREHTTKSHQTARSIVEEDLKQRLQQMDFKLTPTKIFEARSERSKTSCDRSSDSKTHNNSSDASVRSLKRRRKLPFGQRIFDKRSYANKSKHSNKGDDRLSQGSQKDGSSKYHSQSENRRKGKKKKMKAQLRREKEWISKYSSDISTNNKAKRNSLERTNQKPTKIFPLSSSRKEKLGKNRLDEKIDCTIKNAKSDKRTVRTDTKKSSEKENLRNLRKFDQTSNANIHSKTSLSISLSGRNIMSRESKTHPNASTKPVISNKISSNYLLRKNAPQILKTKVDLSRLSNKFNISEKASVNQSFINKPKKSDVKKSNWKKGKKLSSMEENLNSSLRRSHKSNSSLSSESLKSTVKVEKKDEKSSVTSLKTANTSESSKRSKKKRSRQYSRQKDRQLIGNENAKEDVMMNHS
uniref:Bm7682, isoform c n=1 Tax=Brugia malayi TaxID=6279 RepID=A0A1I9G605_BRUMA|nr:Bm7682, isoform c [Brugia malayi]